jgi:hypothetical protein
MLVRQAFLVSRRAGVNKSGRPGVPFHRFKLMLFSFLPTLLLLGWLSPYPTPTVQPAQPMLTFPVPAGVTNQLFYLQRDPNTNTIIYQLNVNSAGQVDEEEPINVFWLRYDEQGQRKELNFIQRKFAYGLTARKLTADKYELKFAAYDKVPFYLLKSGVDKAFHVYTIVANKQILLTRVYLRIEGGTFWVPNVRYIEFKGLDAGTHAPVVTRVKV